MYLLTFQVVRSRMREMLDKAAADTASKDNENNKNVDMATMLSPEVAQSITCVICSKFAFSSEK
eukprot:7320282-Ditylum_brightwellii.AAC.1